MKTDVAEMLFATRGEFRAWLSKNAAASDGVWLLFAKTKDVVTLTANDALEEALCFGWVDGQMKSIDSAKYRKYFSRRRPQSPWSDKNKRLIETLRERNLMTDLGETAVRAAKQNGMWDASPSGAVSDGRIVDFANMLSPSSQAYYNFNAMPLSAKVAFVRMYSSSKNEETRRKHFDRIIEMLDKNQKPTIGSKDNAE